ncbi:UDP-N-acetyl-D-glucosamine 6-dehydrogenase [bacterium HR17]|jgi:UDP-N-acetyl-D-glucosamine dehydrogenase|uniref:UDP-N-acetyl-D-glucosamine 6-dehydrogenase n=1 Tax=Candidatus Fervidibacter japonicus TaxID=2035412 RepID=A0A2H5XE65_9BACT|nr:UDP-N-acetyl-D-glucosamine 6-dehydrogenase [bacterium HR17]
MDEDRIGVIGLGYVGLPLALAFAESGAAVTGVDMDLQRVQTLRQGRSYIVDVTDEQVQRVADRFFPTTAYADLRDCDAVIICVPTPLAKTGDPDISYILAAAEGLSPHLRPGMLVVLESTTYPGTTEEVLKPILERSGLKAGQDFHLAYSPERIDPGNKRWTLRIVPKLVGGLTPACTQRAVRLYSRIVDRVIPVSSPKVAETAKLLENTFRAVNIALVNEFAILCRRMGLSVWEVIDAASTKPFGFMRFDPGPGIGGHCIPIDPLYLAWKAREFNHEPRFIRVADAINKQMPEYVVSLIADALNEHRKPLKGSRVLLLGIAYKPGVNDYRESPALALAELLRAKGSIVDYHDPLVPTVNYGDWRAESVRLTEDELRRTDCVVIVTPHDIYDWAWIVAHAPLVVDTRGVTRHLAAANVVPL